jgi:hypothetical protein
VRGLPLDRALGPRLLQRSALRALQRGAFRCNAVRCVATRCAALQRGAFRCNAVRCVATRCDALQRGALVCNAVRCVATRCAGLQRGALRCNAVRCVAGSSVPRQPRRFGDAGVPARVPRGRCAVLRSRPPCATHNRNPPRPFPATLGCSRCVLCGRKVPAACLVAAISCGDDRAFMAPWKRRDSVG